MVGHGYMRRVSTHICKVMLTRIRSSILPAQNRYHEWDSAPDHELTFNLQARVLELKTWLYRPMVYLAVHYDVPLNHRDIVLSYVQRAIASAVHIGQAEAIRHRHHGTWFALRSILSSTLVMIAAWRRGGLIDYLSDCQDIVRTSIADLDYWEQEAPDIKKGKEILEYLLAKMQNSNPPV